MYRRLIDLTDHLGRPRVCLIGDLMLDRYVYGDAERISQEAPIQVLRATNEEHRLGNAGSVARNLRTLGADVDVFGLVGRDADGEQVVAELKETGARVGGVLRLADRPTTVKTRYIGKAQHRIPQQVLRVDWEDVRPIGRDVEDRLLKRIARSLERADAVVISDVAKGLVTERLAQEAIKLARGRGILVCVDPYRGQDYRKYRGATLLTPNRDETHEASGMALGDGRAVGRAAKALVRNLNLDACVVTLDKEGAYLAPAKGPGRMVPTRPREVYDNAGAGDMVIAVVTLAVAAGASYREAVELANVAGGLEVEKFGVQPVSREEIVADLLSQVRKSGDKLRTADDLVRDLQRHRSLGETVVFTNGCFDILHAGHVAFFEAASRLGDVLVVGLNTDRSVRAQKKGPGRPVAPEDQRVRVLAALAAIDYLCLFDEPTPDRLVRKMRPDVLVKGEDWRERGVVGRAFVESYGGRVELVKLVPGLSTTGILDRIRRAEADGEGRKEGQP